MGRNPGRRTAKEGHASVDLPADAATLDPHVQWDTDSYTIYRNIFDNLLTRDAEGKIVPQIADRLALCQRHGDRFRHPRRREIPRRQRR